jgi:chromosome segregation ATPase
MERIRTFNARRGVSRALDTENSGDAENAGNIVMAGATKKREQYEKRQVKMDKRELEQKYVELQAKLEDTEAFWKDDSRHKDKRICELERQTKSLADSNSFLNIKLKMLEQELADKQEEVSALKQSLAKAHELQRQTALKFSHKFY